MRDRMNLAGKVTAVLAILAVLSVGSIVVTTIEYTQGMRAARNVELELSRLELRDEDDPEVVVTFHLKNPSPITIRLRTFDFELYLNDDFVGRNYALFEERVLAGSEETTMVFVVPVRSFYGHIEQARREEDFSWSVQGTGTLFLSSKGKRIWLIVREYWTGH
jgi:LEA14-like dessication related protein